MDEPRWIEIPADLGALLRFGYRQYMTGADGLIADYATATEDGRTETQIGTQGGDYYLMKLVTTYEESTGQDQHGNRYTMRAHQLTRYYLPCEAQETRAAREGIRALLWDTTAHPESNDIFRHGALADRLRRAATDDPY